MYLVSTSFTVPIQMMYVFDNRSKTEHFRLRFQGKKIRTTDNCLYRLGVSREGSFRGHRK